MRRRQRLETGVWGRRKCTSMEPDSKGTSIREKKNNTRSKDTTDKAARQGRMEGKQLQTLSFAWVLNQEIFLSLQSHAIPEGWHLWVVVPPCGCSVFSLYLYQLSGGGPKANQTKDDKDASEEAGETPSCPPQWLPRLFWDRSSRDKKKAGMWRRPGGRQNWGES